FVLAAAGTLKTSISTLLSTTSDFFNLGSFCNKVLLGSHAPFRHLNHHRGGNGLAVPALSYSARQACPTANHPEQSVQSCFQDYTHVGTLFIINYNYAAVYTGQATYVELQILFLSLTMAEPLFFLLAYTSQRESHSCQSLGMLR
ncbi:MAG: hypothetical protein ABSE82_13680, partial [Nitrososphaerales archaeon]